MVCGAIGLGTLGVGGVACAVAATVVGGVVTDMFADRIGNFVGDRLYDTGKKFVDNSRNDINQCVNRNDGFAKKFCSLLPLKNIARLTPAGKIIDMGTRAIFKMAQPPPDVLPSSNAPLHTGGIRIGRGVNDNSPTLKIRDLDSYTRVEGDVVTVAPSGTDSVTRIGSTGTGTGRAGGTYSTVIDGTVYNRGGTLEINPVQGCATTRNGQCCIEIHRSYCVIDRYKRSKRSSGCASGYERDGRYCYQYADKRHRLAR